MRMTWRPAGQRVGPQEAQLTRNLAWPQAPPAPRHGPDGGGCQGLLFMFTGPAHTEHSARLWLLVSVLQP